MFWSASYLHLIILAKPGRGSSCSEDFQGRRLKLGKGGRLASVQVGSSCQRAASSAFPPMMWLLLPQRLLPQRPSVDRTCCSSGLMSLEKGLLFRGPEVISFTGQEELFLSSSFSSEYQVTSCWLSSVKTAISK